MNYRVTFHRTGVTYGPPQYRATPGAALKLARSKGWAAYSPADRHLDLNPASAAISERVGNGQGREARWELVAIVSAKGIEPVRFEERASVSAAYERKTLAEQDILAAKDLEGFFHRIIGTETSHAEATR